MFPVVSAVALPAMPARAVEDVRAFERFSLEHVPQVDITTHHVLHGGMYARTIRMPAGLVLTGVLVKIPTLLILHGDASAFVGDGWQRFSGHCVLPGSAGRKQAFVAHADTDMTMVFPTTARTVEEAEAEFTDEAALLMSRHGENTITITGA